MQIKQIYPVLQTVLIAPINIGIAVFLYINRTKLLFIANFIRIFNECIALIY